MCGNLYIVSTPIGNLSDVSNRALEILSEVNFIAVEDTRVSKKLLNKYSIDNKMIVYNNFNESKQYDKIINLLKSGNNIALITDAGTPCISDPGYLLVNTCRKEEIDVFSKCKYETNIILVHQDPKLMPKNKNVWSSWNVINASSKLIEPPKKRYKHMFNHF